MPLIVDAVDPLGRPLWFKFFARGGEVLLEEGQLVYRPAAGTQAITVVAVNANGGTTSQDLELTVR